MKVIYFEGEWVKQIDREPYLLVLAGGFGRRLSTVVADVPKPLAPVHGKPFLEHLVQKWIQIGVKRIVFLAHYKANYLVDFVQRIEKLFNYSIEISLIIESNPLGTGGAVANAVSQLDIQDYFLVTNADTWLTNDGMEPLLSKKETCIGAVYIDNSSRYGTLTLLGDKVLSFNEKLGIPVPGWINAGCYVLAPNIFRNWDGNAFSLEHDLLPKLVDSVELSAVRLNCQLIDIGIPEDYFKFCNSVEV
jgi:D-glycero-alpha-D-manno-heptose 1-phosphate guanylyltransferase